MQVPDHPITDALLSDICIATSAAPTYFPHYFKNQDAQGNFEEFNLIDGGIAANNPVRYSKKRTKNGRSVLLIR